MNSNSKRKRSSQESNDVPNKRIKKHCSVPGCNFEGECGLFKFPTNQTKRKIWMENLRMSTSNGLVCFNHFENYHYSKSEDSSSRYSYYLIRGASPKKCFEELSQYSVSNCHGEKYLAL